MVKIEYVFYVIGLIFLFATIIYFAYNYLFDMSDEVKAIVLVCLTIASFFLAEHLRGRDK